MKNDRNKIIDQKVVPEKKSKIWMWILLLIIILLILWWFFIKSNKNNSDQEQVVDNQNSGALVASDQNAQAASIVAANTPETTINDGSLLSLNGLISKINSYYNNNSSDKSEEFNLDFINFNSESSEPKLNDADDVSRLVQVLNDHKNSKIVLRGYTDSTGPDSLNSELSNQRAEAVKDLLLRNGLDTNRISIVGKADANPIASNESKTGRNENRRVTLSINGK